MNGYLLSWIIFGTYLLALSSCESKQYPAPEMLQPIRLMQVKKSDTMYRYYTGGIDAVEYSNLGFPISGPLMEMRVDAGEKVRKGTILAVIDPLDDQLNYESNRAAYITAKAQLERNLRLLKIQAVSRQEYERSQAAYVRMESMYKSSVNRLENTRLRAPFDGYITKKYVTNYQRVDAGQPIVRLMNPERMEVVFILPETSVAFIHESLSVAVEFDGYPGHWFAAKIKDVVDASIDGSGIPVRLTLVDSTFDTQKYTIYPGFSCRVRLAVDIKSKVGFTVPLCAVFRDLQTNALSVWVYNPLSSRVSRRKIIVDELSGCDFVRVISGLQGAEQVVVSGVTHLAEGEMVNVITD